MNENQKERLLKIAETNPELAKEMMDFMKEERQSPQEPIAVKMVKAEEDKLTFTEEQKKWAIASIAIPLTIIISFFILIAILDYSNLMKNASFIVDAFILSIFVGILATWGCVYKAGIPTIKQFISKHFKYLSN